jgi:hypothetical protein
MLVDKGESMSHHPATALQSPVLRTLGKAPGPCDREGSWGRGMLKPLVCYMALLLVTAFWLWVGDRKPIWGRRTRDEERCVEHRLNAALIAHKMHFAVTFNEALARLVDALVTLRVIFGDGTSLDRNQNDTRMMVPASGASRFKDNLYNRKVCRTPPTFHFDALVLGFELAQRCSRYLGCGHRGGLST